MCFPSWVKHPELLDKVPNLGTAKPANHVTYVGAPAIEKARVRTHDAHGACDRGARDSRRTRRYQERKNRENAKENSITGLLIYNCY